MAFSLPLPNHLALTGGGPNLSAIHIVVYQYIQQFELLGMKSFEYLDL